MQLKSFVQRRAMAGSVTLITRRGRVISKEAIGFRSLQSKEPMLIDTIFGIGPVTNPVTAIGPMILMEEQTSEEKRFEGKWWASADPAEQRGFIVGYIDCYYDTLRRRVRSKAITDEYQKAISNFYAAHPDQNGNTVLRLMAKLVQTLKTTVVRQPGGEVWNGRHGYLDGQWWRESTDTKRIGFLEGYTSCYEQYVKRPRVRFSRTAEEYLELLTEYFEDPRVDHTDEKIANVLHRLAAILRKRMWSPPDNSFTIEVPVKLREIKGKYNDESHERFRSIKLFGTSEAEASFGVFQVVILYLSEKEQRNVSGKLKGLEFLIGGDDQRPTSETELRVDGLAAREVLLVGPSKCSKGLFIDAGDRIYVLGSVGKVCEDLDTATAKRFFKTFHRRRHK